MEPSEVRRRVTETIARSKRDQAARRARNAETAPHYERFLEAVATPLLQQVASVLKAEKYSFSVNTPAGAVRLFSERSPEDFLEIRLETRSAMPQVLAHVERVKGHETSVDDVPIRPGVLVQHLTEEDVLDVVAEALAVFVEK